MNFLLQEAWKLSLVANDWEFSFLNLTPITVVYFACWINCIAEMIWFCIEARQDLRSKSIRNCCKASVFRCYWKLNVIARKKYYIKKQCFHPWNSIFALLSTTKILLTCALVLYTNGRHYIHTTSFKETLLKECSRKSLVFIEVCFISTLCCLFLNEL